MFDVFGTLVDWRSTVAQAFGESGLAGDPDELAVAWRERLWPVTAEVNKGERPWGNFDELHLATLDGLLADRELHSQSRLAVSSSRRGTRSIPGPTSGMVLRSYAKSE